MCKKKDVSAFEQGMVPGAHQFATLLGFSTHNSFPMCIKNGSPPKGHSANLTQLWEAL
jgi:hypothetical protein